MRHISAAARSVRRQQCGADKSALGVAGSAAQVSPSHRIHDLMSIRVLSAEQARRFSNSKIMPVVVGEAQSCSFSSVSCSLRQADLHSLRETSYAVAVEGVSGRMRRVVTYKVPAVF